MLDQGIGRLLVASLHMGIADALPDRLEFYEHWLRPAEGGDSRVSMASLGAVLSFLRGEGQPSYDEVMGRAGRWSAEWTVSGLSPLTRGFVGRMPRVLRARLVLRLSRQLVRGTYLGSSATVRLGRRTGAIAIRDSIFCNVREPSTAPMCAFYAAGVEHMLRLFGVEAAVEIGECRAEGAAACRLHVALGTARREAPAAEAA